MKSLLLVVLVLALAAPATAAAPTPQMDPGGGGNSFCWSGLGGSWAYFADYQSRMIGWFQCWHYAPGVPFIVRNKPGYGDVYPYCSTGSQRYTWGGWMWWKATTATC